jgi:hypothetical protein
LICCTPCRPAFGAAAFFFALLARAADRVLQLQNPPPVGKDAAATPPIAGPSNDAERRINAALKRQDRAYRRHHAPSPAGKENRQGLSF